MTFFCSKCQRRHDIKSISADMWGICRKDVSAGLDELTRQVQNELDISVGSEVADLFDAMSRFVNEVEMIEVETPYFRGETRVNSFFALNLNNIKELNDINRKDRVISGTYTIPMEKILTLFETYGTGRTERMKTIARTHLKSEWKQIPICEKEIRVSFDENYNLDKVTDTSNVAFKVDGKEVGFHRICAYCGRELSRAAGRAEEVVVALAGSPRAGKTSCMIAMINTLLSENVHGIRVLEQHHDEEWAKLKKEVEAYRLCQKVDKTPKDEKKEVPAHSLLLEFNDEDNKSSRNDTKLVLTIVDMPGEYWLTEGGLTTEFYKQYSGIYENIDCIWNLVSKFTIRLSDSQIPDSIASALEKNTSESVTIINESGPANMMQSFEMLKQHLAPRNISMPPMITIITKPDYYVSDIDEEQTNTYELFPHRSKDVNDSNAQELKSVLKYGKGILKGLRDKPLYTHAASVRSFVSKINPSFVSATERTFQSRFYVSVSPYGRPAYEKGGEVGSPMPYHELYPLLWTLAITGFMRVYHECQWLKRNWLRSIVGSTNSEEYVRYDYRKNSDIQGKDRRVKDMNTILRDVKSSLFMQNESYAKTVIRHKKG